MLETYRRSIVALLALPDRSGCKLAGTGTVITPNIVLTCCHVSDSCIGPIPDGGDAFLGQVLLDNSPLPAPRRYRRLRSPDLCLLEFDELPNAVPLRIARTEAVDNLEVTAIGFQPDMRGPRIHMAQRLRMKSGDHRGRWLYSGQLSGGTMPGYSGSPVLAPAGDDWLCIGILGKGGETAAYSRFLAAEPIVEFLARESIALDCTELPRPPQPPFDTAASTQTLIEAGDLRDSKIMTDAQQTTVRVKNKIRGLDLVHKHYGRDEQ